MAKIQKISDSGSINIWGETEKPVAPEKPIAKVSNKRKFEASAASKMDNSNMINSRGDKFLSAGMGMVKDEGGSSKFIGSESQNSIWDTNIVEKLANIKRSDEISTETKEEVKKYRNGIKEESLTRLAESISNTDTRKEATITPLSNQDGSAGRSQYRMPSGGISMFDANFEFNRVPENTSSDVARKEAQKDKPKDRSWAEPAKQVKAQDFVDRMLDNLLKDKK